MRSKDNDRSASGVNLDTAEGLLLFGRSSLSSTESVVDQEDRRASTRRKKRRRKEEPTSWLSPNVQFELSFEVKETELIDLLCVHRNEEAKELEVWKQMMTVSAELLSKEDALMAQLEELREERRTCDTAVGDVLNRIDTCRAHIEATESELAAIRGKKIQDDAHLAYGLEKELKKLYSEALANLEIEREKNMCQICMNFSRNALVLPCMHFLYCSECLLKHQTAKSDCPTCRGPITAMLLCKFDSDQG